MADNQESWEQDAPDRLYAQGRLWAPVSEVEALERGRPQRVAPTRQPLTAEVLDRLPRGVVTAASDRYAETVGLWERGVHHATQAWVVELLTLAAGARGRLEELLEEGLVEPGDREEYLTNAAMIRGVIWGWCLREAVVEESRSRESEGDGLTTEAQRHRGGAEEA